MNKRKKGFTIVELVIVIAVIAILAAVLIPTFSNLINQSKVSADVQAVRQMNVALASDEAMNGRCETVEEALDVLMNAGYKANEYNALASGYKFYWDSSTNRVVLWGNGKIEYPEDAAQKYADYKDEFTMNFKSLNIDDYVVIDKIDGQEIATKEALTAALKNAASFQTVRLAGDVTLTAAELRESFSETKSTNIDLNEKTLGITGYALQVDDGNQVSLSNGTVSGSISVVSSGRLSLDQVKVEERGAGYGVWLGGEAAEVLIEDSEIIGTTYGITTNASTSDNYGVAATVKNTVIRTIQTEEDDNTALLLNVRGKFEFENCTIEGGRQAVVCRAGSFTFKSCTINGRGWIPDESSGEYPYSQEENCWETGNRVATAAITVGVKAPSSSGYIGDAVVILDRCTVTAQNNAPLVYLAGTGHQSTYTKLLYTNCPTLEAANAVQFYPYLTAANKSGQSVVVGKAGDILINGTAVNANAS